MFASLTWGFDAKRCSIHSMIGATGREYIQQSRPSAKKFFDRSASRALVPSSLVALTVIEVIGTWYTVKAASELSSSGFAVYPAFSRSRGSKLSEFTISVVPGAISARFAFNAAGFIATRTFGASPGVTMSWSEMCTWNDETPATVPAGARISAG